MSTLANLYRVRAGTLYARKQLSEKIDQQKVNTVPYFVDDGGYLCRWKQTKDGRVSVRLCNSRRSSG